MAELMSIGEFASATWLSPKALRFYDRSRLLSPALVDPANGYRKYSAEQVEDARLITLLRRIDMPLAEIRALLAAPEAERAARIADHRRGADEQHARRQALAEYLEDAITLGAPGRAADPRFTVTGRLVPDVPVLSATRHSSARELPDVIRRTGAQLLDAARERGGARGGIVVIYHGQVGWESDGPVEVCVPVAAPSEAHRVEPAHEELFTPVPAGDVQFPRILDAFDAVAARAAALGLAPLGPPREVYSPGGSPAAPRCEVALPVGPGAMPPGPPPATPM